MKRLFAIALLACLPGIALAQVSINNLPAASGVSGSDVLPTTQGGTTTRKVTAAQLLAYIDLSLIIGSPTAGHCVQWSSPTALADAGAACGSGGGSGAFSAITSGTNTAAAMVVSTGATLNPAGTGVINANQFNGAVVAPSLGVVATNVSAQFIAATAATIPNNTLMGNQSGGTATPAALTAPQVGTVFASGTTFTLGTGTGACTASSTLVGSDRTGSFKCTGTAGASTQVINLPTATNGWACHASDVTSGVVWGQVVPIAVGTCKITGTLTTTSDVVVFSATQY